MTKHFQPMEFKGDDDKNDPIAIVSESLEKLTKTVDERIKAIETKGIDPKLLERINEIEKKANRPNGGSDDLEKKKQEELETKAFRTYLQHGPGADQLELKVLTVSSDPGGGYLAPPEFSSEFLRDLIDVSPIRSIASVRQTAAPAVQYPTRTGVGSNANWVGEIEDRPKSEPTFGQTEIPVNELATYVEASNQLLADSGGKAESEVRLALSEDFAQKEGSAFVNGNGIKKPMGFMADSRVAYTANGHATNLSTDALITLMYAVPAQYRRNGTWVLNSTALATIRKLKDGQGNYIWQPSFQAGAPETILGRPVVDVVDMEDVGSGTHPIAFGDFKAGYRILDRIDMRVLVDPYTRATNGITRIHAWRRVGGAVIRPDAIRKLKMATS